MTNDRPKASSNRLSRDWMSLFSGFTGSGGQEAFDTHTAVMAPIVAAMLADGRVEQGELRQIRSICASSPIFARNSEAENEFLVSRCVQIIEDVGLAEACSKAAAALSPALRETAFVHALRVVFSDGYVGPLEREVTEQMMDWLRIDHDRARVMTDIVSVMQHPVEA